MDRATLDPNAVALASRVTVTVDHGNSGKYAPVRLTVKKHNGEVVTHKVDDYRGSAAMPLAAANLKEKLASCIEDTGRQAQAGAIDSCFDDVMNIERVANVQGFVRRFMMTAAT
jgi:hypothetical protein